MLNVQVAGREQQGIAAVGIVDVVHHERDVAFPSTDGLGDYADVGIDRVVVEILDLLFGGFIAAITRLIRPSTSWGVVHFDQPLSGTWAAVSGGDRTVSRERLFSNEFSWQLAIVSLSRFAP